MQTLKWSHTILSSCLISEMVLFRQPIKSGIRQVEQFVWPQKTIKYRRIRRTWTCHKGVENGVPRSATIWVSWKREIVVAVLRVISYPVFTVIPQSTVPVLVRERAALSFFFRLNFLNLFWCILLYTIENTEKTSSRRVQLKPMHLCCSMR